MSATNRSQLINKLFKVAKKNYAPVSPVSSRGVLDHMLYACCLENSQYIAADEAFARLEQNYFDWNEVRVTTTTELAESLKGVADAEVAAIALKKTLHGVFETYYKFDIDFLRKENLRKTVQQFGKFRGVSPFVVYYSAQTALGGHFIPVDQALINLMSVLGVISEAEAEKNQIPGLERAIPKTKGIEFASVAHQLAADYHKSPFNKDIRDLICSISASAKDRFPKRGGRSKKKKASAAAESSVKAPASKSSKTADKKAKKTAEKKTAEKKSVKKTPVKKSVKKKATSGKKTAAGKSTARKSKSTASKKSSAAGSSSRKKTTRKPTAGKAAGSGKKSTTRSLSRKKPR